VLEGCLNKKSLKEKKLIDYVKGANKGLLED
jgi:hypothetical protein